MECLDEGLIQAYIDGETNARDAKNIELHLAECSDCASKTEIQKRTSKEIKNALNQLSVGSMKPLPLELPKTKSIKVFTLKRMIYIVSAASILFFAIAFFGDKKQTQPQPPTLFYELDWEVDANKPITDQDFTISVWEMEESSKTPFEQ